MLRVEGQRLHGRCGVAAHMQTQVALQAAPGFLHGLLIREPEGDLLKTELA